MDSNEQIASEISARIKALENMAGDGLKNEMQGLKKAILDNPAACFLLHEEDIGSMITALRKITGQAITTATATKTKTAANPTKQKKLSAEELAAALDDEDF
jgi:hypothetical protein